MNSTLTHSETVDLETGCAAFIPGFKTEYGYVPSLAPGAIFCVLFGLSLVGHLIQSVRKRQWTSYMFAVGALTETIGWAGRAWSSQCPYNHDAFLMQITTLIIAPTFFTAGAYLILGRLIRIWGPEVSPISPRLYLYIFCTCDVLALVLQSIGGGKASTASNSPNGDPKVGTNIMVGGIVFQMASVTVFVLFLAIVLLRLRQRGKGGPFSQHEGGFRRVVAALLLSITTIYIRSIYRTIELVQGWSGFLITHERFFIALDAAMMTIAVIVFNIFDPAVLLGSKEESTRSGLTGDTGISEGVLESSVSELKENAGTELARASLDL